MTGPDLDLPGCPSAGEQAEANLVIVTSVGGGAVSREIGRSALKRAAAIFTKRRPARKLPPMTERPAIAGGAPVPTGLRHASAGLRALFADGSVAGRSIIGVRDTLTRHGFSRQVLSNNKKGYRFLGPADEEVRVMRRGGGWDIRIQNSKGNQLDEYGNAGTQQTSHGIPLRSR
jgi:hypothetical protein